MIPAGYLLKTVAAALPGFPATVRDVHSVSPHVSPDFTDYIPLWRHNGWWLFDEPEVPWAIAREAGLDLAALALFYYEYVPEEYDEASGTWRPFAPEPSIPVAVVPPARTRLSGYDVVTFECRNAPECSPLSCNGLAAELPVNAHCLLDSPEAARAALAAGAFTNTEPGPFRIVAVHRPG